MTLKKILQPKVSVIVAVYNQERFIGRCLRSLLHQTFPHEQYEIIVVDDGSSDRTPYALGLFTDRFDSPVKVITNQQNIGLPASLNRGIHAAKADLVVRVDSDDYVNANFLNFLVFYMMENPHADAVACDYYLVDDDEVVRERVSCVEKPIACGIVFRRNQLIELGLYDESFLWHEDKDLRIRFEQKYSISNIDLPLYRYRRHSANITNDSENMKIYHEALVSKHGAQKI